MRLSKLLNVNASVNRIYSLHNLWFQIQILRYRIKASWVEWMAFQYTFYR